MIRAFLAVELEDALRKQLAQVQQDLKQRLFCEDSKHVRMSWAQPAAIHLTIKFLGDIEERLIEPLREAIEPLTRSHPIVHIPIEQLGAFPHLRQPRVLWVGPSERWETGDEAKQLALFHQDVETSCQSIGLASDGRPLTPHLTLARIKEGERVIGQLLATSGVTDRLLSLGDLPVRAVVLMKSELLPSGSRYTRLWEVS